MRGARYDHAVDSDTLYRWSTQIRAPARRDKVSGGDWTLYTKNWRSTGQSAYSAGAVFIEAELLLVRTCYDIR